MESLSAEIAPFGIHTTIVNPGFFRTRTLTDHSTSYAAPSIADTTSAEDRWSRYLEVAERPAGRRPCEAGARPLDHRRTGAAAAPLHRWRGRHRRCGAEAPRPEGRDRFQPDAFDVPRIRLGEKRWPQPRSDGGSFHGSVRLPPFLPKYWSSRTCSSHPTTVPSCASWMAIWLMELVGDAPCQCLMPGGIQITLPVRISRLSPPSC